MQNLTQSNFRARWGGENPAVVKRIQNLIKMTQWEPITDDGVNIIGWKNRDSGEISLGVKKPCYEN